MVVANNPINPGFYPDPSICAVGDDFYMVHSSFAYFPGVPIFHSKDLANWEQIGHVLDRESQLPLKGQEISGGIYAPTIRYHNGVFYMITTNIEGCRNFIVTASDPAGDWSEPIYIDGAEGIDPSLFFDEDGSCYYTGTKSREPSRYFGDGVIYCRKLDVATGKFLSEEQIIWDGAAKHCEWAEGPHLYKKDGYYYLMIAEGGTGDHHAVTIARSENVFGPYESCRCNPILTHRHLGKAFPVRYVGHADLVETQDGWYMVCLASRPINGVTATGRETFLAKVIWEDGWPVVNPGIGHLTEMVEINLPEYDARKAEPVIRFEEDELDQRLVSIRNPEGEFWTLAKEPGRLCMKCKKERLGERSNPAFLGVRQQHSTYEAYTQMEFEPAEGESAGIVLFQNDDYYLSFLVTKENGIKSLQVVSCVKGNKMLLSSMEATDRKIELYFNGHEQKVDCSFAVEGVKKNMVCNINTDEFTTERAGGFVGCIIGMYASGGGRDSDNHAEFARFVYSGMEMF